ncbi:class I SAM-dependent methyltransferase [Helicobacter sp. 23-1044]
MHKSLHKRLYKRSHKGKLVSLPFKDESFEIVCMLAVLEHLNHPLLMLKEIKRVLKKNGILLLSVPSHAAKPILEFLSYKLKLIDEAEIRDHKRYYNKADLARCAEFAGLKMEGHYYFQCGFNNFAKMRKI